VVRGGRRPAQRWPCLETPAAGWHRGVCQWGCVVKEWPSGMRGGGDFYLSHTMLHWDWRIKISPHSTHCLCERGGWKVSQQLFKESLPAQVSVLSVWLLGAHAFLSLLSSHNALNAWLIRGLAWLYCAAEHIFLCWNLKWKSCEAILHSGLVSSQ
jgi:hypothetical protein